MLKKVVGLAAIAGAVALMAGAGCSVTTTNTSTTDGGGTTTGEGGTTPTTDGGGGGGDAKPPVKTDGGTTPAGCYDENGAISLKKDTPAPSRRNVCTTAQISGFYAACLGSGAAQAACKTFMDDAANKACMGCVNGEANGPAPVLLPANADGDSVFANVFACGSITIGKPECANTIASYNMCLASSCADCADDASENTCYETAAKSTFCKETEPTKDCTDAYTAGKAAIDSACRGSNFEGTFNKVAAFLCGGGGPADSGGGG